MNDDREKGIMMLTLEDATAVATRLCEEYYGEELTDDDKEGIEQDLEQKCYFFSDGRFPEKFLGDIIADINKDEICEQIHEDHLSDWTRSVRNNMALALSVLVKQRDGETGLEKPL